MKKIWYYKLTFVENSEEKEQIELSKFDLVREYLNLLGSGRNISSLRAYVYEGKDDPEYRNITWDINRFLAR